MAAREIYVCARCSKRFMTAWSEEEARAERVRNFPDEPPERMAVVCDDCFRLLMRLHGRTIR